MDTSVDRKLANDGNYTSIFSEVIGRELSHNSSGNLYSRFRVDFASNSVRTEAPHSVDLELLVVNTYDEVNIFGNRAKISRSPTDLSYGSDSDHVFGKYTAVEMSATRLEQYYS